MAGRFKNTWRDFLAFVLTIIALIIFNIGFFIGPWWRHEGEVGQSEFGMLTLRICRFSCVDRDVLVLEGGREWVLTVRILEVFGEIFLLIATLMMILALIVRRRPIHTAIIYLHGAAALFILVGVFIFLGFNSTLDEGLETSGSVQYPFALCLVGGIICIVTSVVSGYNLSWHLLHFEDDDEMDIQHQDADDPGY